MRHLLALGVLILGLALEWYLRSAALRLLFVASLLGFALFATLLDPPGPASRRALSASDPVTALGP